MSKFVFGPILSRRLGRSLGIDIIPFKTCSFNCVYCELGESKELYYKRDRFYNIDEIIDEIDLTLKDNPQLDYITISGSGEPTLSLDLGNIITYLKKNYPQYKICLITNSTLLNNDNVINEIKDIDLLIPSLDAATQDVLNKIDRPSHKSLLKIDDIIEGIKKAKDTIAGETWLEIFIVPGINDTKEELTALKKAINYISPQRVQLNTIDRPGTEDWVRDLKEHEKEYVESILGVNFITKKEINGVEFTQNEIDSLENILLKSLKLRPQTIQELSHIYKKPIGVIGAILDNMKNRKLVYEKAINGKIYFCAH